MSSAGHIFDMINKMRQNKALKNLRRERHAAIKEAYRNHPQWQQKSLMRQNTLTRDELVVIKQQIRNKLIGQQRSVVIKSILMTGIVIGVIIWVLLNLSFLK